MLFPLLQSCYMKDAELDGLCAVCKLCFNSWFLFRINYQKLWVRTSSSKFYFTGSKSDQWVILKHCHPWWACLRDYIKFPVQYFQLISRELSDGVCESEAWFFSIHFRPKPVHKWNSIWYAHVCVISARAWVWVWVCVCGWVGAWERERNLVAAWC